LIFDGEAHFEISGLPDACVACNDRLRALVPDDRILNCRKIAVLNRGERLSSHGDAGLCLWVILEGVAATCTTLADGRRQIVSLELGGDLLCGMSTADGTDAQIEALTDCRLCEIDVTSATEPLLQNPAVAASMFHHVHRRLERAAVHLTALGRLDSMERICLFLLQMARRTGRQDGRALKAELGMSREDIADYLGLNAETVSRVMGRVKRRGLAVFLSPTAYVVPDVRALERRIPLTFQGEFPMAAPANGHESHATGGCPL